MSITITTDANGQVIFTPLDTGTTTTLQTDTGQTLELDPSMTNLLKTSSQATIPIPAPGTISAKDFIGQTTKSISDSKAQDQTEKQNNPLYYKLFGLGLIGVLERLTYLQGNLDAFVQENNDLNTLETSLYGSMDSVTTINQLSTQMNAAVNNYNTATQLYNDQTTLYNNGQITQAQYDAATANYNAAVTNYNNQVASLNGQMATALGSYTSVVTDTGNPNSFNSQVAAINQSRTDINTYTSNFNPPQTPYPLLDPYPVLTLGTAGIPPANPGTEIDYSPVNIPDVPTPVAAVDSDTIQSDQIDPLADDNSNIKALLEAGSNAVDFNAALKQFGLRTSLTVKSEAKNIDTSSSGSSAAFAANSADTASSSKTLPSDLSKSAVEAQVMAQGIPNGSPLVSATGYLVSNLFQSTGLYSFQKALETLGLILPSRGQPGVGPVTTSPAATGQVGSISGQVSAAVSANAAEQPNPNTGVIPGVSAADLDTLTTAIAGVANVLAASDVINGGVIENAVTAIVNADPNLANLTPEQKAQLINALTGAITFDLSLASLFSLSIALGAPSLLSQYLGNVSDLASQFPSLDSQSPADIVINNPANIVFFQQIISDSLQNDLGLSQQQADQVAQQVVTTTIQQNQLQNAQQLQQALQTNLQQALVSQGISQADAVAEANQTAQQLNDINAFNAAQSAAIQESQIKSDLASSLNQQNINEADASRAAAIAVDQNKALIRDQLLDTDAAAKRVSDVAVLGQIVDSLSGAGIPKENAQIAANFAFERQQQIGLNNIAIKRPVADSIISRDQLAGEIATSVYNALVNLGLQRATAISSQITSSIIISPNSFINRNNAYVDASRDNSLNKYNSVQLDQFRQYLRPTLDSYVAAENFMDPGKIASHNAATGVMYSQPVAIKNTPPIAG